MLDKNSNIGIIASMNNLEAPRGTTTPDLINESSSDQPATYLSKALRIAIIAVLAIAGGAAAGAIHAANDIARMEEKVIGQMRQKKVDGGTPVGPLKEEYEETTDYIEVTPPVDIIMTDLDK